MRAKTDGFLVRVAALGVAGLSVCGPLSGCATSRYDELKDRSREVKRSLEKERDAVLEGDRPGPRERLDHLNSLRTTLSAVNVGLSAVRYGLEEERRPVAYDVIGEAYDTIEWNIPLLPGDTAIRGMPAAFRGGRFDAALLPDGSASEGN